MQSFNLDVTHYVSLPQFTLDACMKYTKKCVELVKDPDVYLFLEGAVCGGLCTIGDARAAMANNEICENFDASKAITWLLDLDLDKNNLYALGLSSHVPAGDYRFESKKTVEQAGKDIKAHLAKLADDGEEGEIL